MFCSYSPYEWLNIIGSLTLLYVFLALYFTLFFEIFMLGFREQKNSTQQNATLNSSSETPSLLLDLTQ